MLEQHDQGQRQVDAGREQQQRQRDRQPAQDPEAVPPRVADPELGSRAAAGAEGGRGIVPLGGGGGSAAASRAGPLAARRGSAPGWAYGPVHLLTVRDSVARALRAVVADHSPRWTTPRRAARVDRARRARAARARSRARRCSATKPAGPPPLGIQNCTQSVRPEPAGRPVAGERERARGRERERSVDQVREGISVPPLKGAFSAASPTMWYATPDGGPLASLNAKG
jgi:hypothetical protein